MAGRSDEVTAAMVAADRLGLCVVMATFTMRHRLGQPLADLWGAKSGAWGAVTSGSSWRDDVARHGLAGWLAVTEVTHGANGWHVHVHALLFADPAQLDVETLQARMVGRWSRSLVRRGLSAPLMVGQDMHVVTGAQADEVVGGYLAKQTHDAHVAAQRAADRRSVSLEVTHSQAKSGGGEHATRTPWALLDGVAAGDADDLDLWHEWEQGSHGRRQMTWSKGLRDRLAVGESVDDETLAAAEVGTAADTLLVIEPEGWDRLVREPARVPLLLDAAEDGRDRLIALLARWDVPWRDHLPSGGSS